MDRRIMLVDDAAFMTMVLKDILTRNGYEVVAEARDGIEAVEKYKELQPNMVLMDITMPNMNGIQAVRAIKEYDSKAKIVMCSAIGQQSVMDECKKAGALGYIVKPFKEERVLKAVKKVIG